MIMNMNTRSWREGFTLIEILVVLAIIGILSAVLYANFGDARQEARNKAMQAEIKETQLALELYKSQNGRYPEAFAGCATVTGFAPNQITTTKSSTCGANPIISGLTPDFTSELPVSAKSGNGNCDIKYQVDTANGTWYKLTAVRCHAGATGVSDGIQSGDELARCSSVCNPLSAPCIPATSDFYESYAVYSAGGECF